MFEWLPLEPARADPHLAAELDELDRTPVGADLAMRLGQLPPLDSAAWTPRLRIRVAARWNAIATWAEAQALAQLGAGAAAVEARESPIEALNYVTDFALETHAGEGWADRQVVLAGELTNRLHLLAAAIGRGALTTGHARTLARVLASADDATARQIDQRVTPSAVEHGWTPGQLAAAARRMLLRLDQDGGAARHEDALDRYAGVAGGSDGDGLAWLSATGDAVTVADILTAVERRAEQLTSLAPDAPAGRVRFAALSDLVLGDGFTLFDHVMGVEGSAAAAATTAAAADPGPATASASTSAPTPASTPASAPTDSWGRRRRRREVIVTIDLPTLLGLRDQPGQLAGFGPIPARLASLIATDASLRRLVTDPVTGEALDLGRRSYSPTGALVTAIRAVQRTCRFPGCTRAHRPEIDHRTDWSRGGETAEGNMQLLCRRHHALKTAGLWNARRRSDGAVVWTGPDGQTVVRRPADRDEGGSRGLRSLPLSDTG